ncbi:MAG: helix-turn-helix domain-containing protein [Clostridia bacterium]|nr:helix-turn-helix domain-containing protein [Clostridia bacterium]
MNQTVLFSYRDEQLYFHHTVTPSPDPDNFPFRLHSHHMHELYYFAGGDGDFTVEGVTYPLSKGTLILSAGGQVHHLNVRNRGTPYERIVLMFGMKLLPESAEELIRSAERGHHVFHLNGREQVWFEECCMAIEGGTEEDVERRDALLSFLRMLLVKMKSLAALSSGADDPENETVREIVRYVNRNLTAPLSLSLLEKEFFRDKATLNRCFKSVMGCGIWEYVIRKRIFNARQELYVSGSINAAFLASGFGDYSVFYRNYTRVTGLSPSADLKRMKAGE